MELVRRFVFQRPIAVVGDLHGQLDLLDKLLLELGDRPLVVVGDVIDRGPDTRGVVARLIERGAVGVRGNHEEWMLAWLRGDGLDRYAIRPKMGGLAALRSYGAMEQTHAALESQAWRIPDEHRQFFEELALVGDLRVEGAAYWLVHAGLPAHVSFEGVAYDQIVPWLARHHGKELLWGTNEPEAIPPVDRPVIMGHLVRDEPLDTGDVLAIDTGAGTVVNGRLTAVLLPERAFVTVGID